jgi:hypothetical protein
MSSGELGGPVEESPRLKPLDLGDLLDQLVVVYRRGFLTFIGIQLVVLVPIVLLAALLGPVGGPAPVEFILSLVTWLLRFAWTCCAVSLLYLQHTTGIRAAGRLLLRRAWALVRMTLLWLVLVPLWMSTIVYLWMGANPILLVIGLPLAYGAAFIAAPWGLCVPALLLEEPRGVVSALGRSAALVRGARARTALTLLALFSIWGPLTMFIGRILWGTLHSLPLPAALLEMADGAQLYHHIPGLLTAPVLGIGITLFYYDRRVRTEAFDLVVWARDLAGPSAPDSAEPRARQ